MSEAFNEMHRRSKTPYFVQVDADMILNPNAVQTLYDGVCKSFPWEYAVYGPLYEEGFGVGGTVRCWKRSFFRFFQFRDVRTVDRDLFGRAKRFLLRRKNLKVQMGIHRPRHSNFSEYLKTKSDVEKWRFLKRAPELYALPLFDEIIKNPNENRFKFLGLLAGAMTSMDRVVRSKNIKHEHQELENILKELKLTNLDQLMNPKIGQKGQISISDLRVRFARQYRTEETVLLLKEVFAL
jgi:hypothetical protein